eukprot:232913-Amphidinium_carterae.1
MAVCAERISCGQLRQNLDSASGHTSECALAVGGFLLHQEESTCTVASHAPVFLEAIVSVPPGTKCHAATVKSS